MSATQIAVLTGLMLVTGAIGAITGGNSLINVPLMIMVGMTPRQAVATNMFAVTFMTISATARFARARVLKLEACCCRSGSSPPSPRRSARSSPSSCPRRW